MITPRDIEEKEFSKSMRGYNCIEVDSYLDEIISEFEKLLLEKEAMRKEIEKLRQEVEQNKKSETTVMNTLESAKKLMKDISESAERRAEIIIKNATLDAAVMQRDAKDSISKLSKEKEDLEERVAKLKTRYKNMLEDELAHLDNIGSDLFDDFTEVSTFATEDDLSQTRVVDSTEDDDAKDLAEAIFNDMSKPRDHKNVKAEETKVNLDLNSLTNSASSGLQDDKTIVGGKDTKLEFQEDSDPIKDSVFAPKETVVLDSKAIDELIKKEEEKLKR